MKFYIFIQYYFIIIIFFLGRIIDNDKERTISAKLLDDTIEYSFKAGVYKSGDSNHQVLKPLLEYKIPDFKTKETGLIGVKGGAKGGKSQKAVAVTGKYIFNIILIWSVHSVFKTFS